MKFKTLLAAGAVGVALGLSVPAQAFECPTHFKEAQAAIDKVAGAAKGAAGSVAKGDLALVHALLDDAKMLLASGRHNHEKPQGAYDHARAMSKSDAALGHAEAAGRLLQFYQSQ